MSPTRHSQEIYLPGPPSLRSEPFRIFFPAGILASLLGTWHWLLMPLGWAHAYPNLRHGLLEIQGFAAFFFAGYLLTYVPRFTRTAPAKPWEILLIGAVLVLQVLLALAGLLHASAATFSLAMLLLGVPCVYRMRVRKSRMPSEFTYLVFAFAHAVIGGLLIAHPLRGFSRLGERILEQGMTLSFILALGTFFGNRLLGYREHVSRASRENLLARSSVRKALFAALGTALYGSFFFESAGRILWGKGLRAAVVVVHFMVLHKFWRIPHRKTWSALVLWISLLAVTAGLVLSAAVPSLEPATLHIMFVAGFALMLLMLGLRVSAFNAGAEPVWDHRSPVVLLIGACCLAAAGLRGAAHFAGDHANAVLAIAAACWTLAVVAWSIKVAPLLYRWPKAAADGEAGA